MLSDKEILEVLTQSKDAAAIYDSPALTIRFVNAAMLEIWGKESDIIGKTLEEALPELHDQPFFDILKNVWETGETYRAIETPATLVISGKSKTSYFDFEFRPLKNANGQTMAILHTAIDVTSRILAWRTLAEKQRREEQLIEELSATNNSIQAVNDNLSAANQGLIESNENINRLNLRLQESETDFKRLVAQAPVAILVFRGENMVIDLANKDILEILGKDADVIGKPLLEGFPELKGEPAVELLFDVYRTGKSFNGEEVPVNMMRNGKMETRYFNFSYRPLMDEGAIIGIMDIAVEVTTQVVARKNLEVIVSEKSHLEKDLRANERRLQGVLDTMAEGVVIVNDKGIPSYANPMAQRIMGVPESAFIDRRYEDFQWQNQRLDGSPLPKEDHPMFVALQTGLPVYDQEVGIQLAGSKKIYISINAAPLIDDNGTVYGGIVTFMDVTNRRMVSQQKDDFISVASHELKTPIAALKGALQLLDRMLPGIEPDMLTKLVKQSNKSLNKLTELVNSLLNMNRISRGRFPINKTTFRVTDLINDCCAHITTAGTHKIILQGDVDLHISADERLVDQVIVNFINNAIKYAPDSREILFNIRKLKDEVKISVTDYGPGISADKLPHIFERYYQAENDNLQFSGLGLGLYISAEIIERHGGKIGADSELGKGTTFWFTLPLE